MAREKTPTSATAAAKMPGGLTRAVVSLLVALHLAAVFIGPWSMGGSALSTSAARIAQPYLEVLNLNNGYRFFAPEPGPSHLVRYEITRADGTRVEGFFPDRTQHRPRLLYHRHFMLSEFLNTLQNPSAQPLAEAYAQSYAEHLLAKHEGKSIKLFLRRHYVPRVSEVQEGRRLDDPVLYQEQLLVSYEPDTQ